MEIDLFSAFLVGVLGAGHCIGMCGGITTMLTAALPASNTSSKAILTLCYNLGRIASYALIGAIVGFTGSIASKSIGVPIGIMRLIAAIFLIFLGLYIGQWLMWLNRIESLGKIIWSKISPYSKKLIPVDSAKKALALGALWGWLPCGLVYSTLTWSLASGDALYGAAIMASFGLGTLPALITVSLGFQQVSKLLKNKRFRKISAFFIILYGFYSIVIAYELMF